MDDLLDYIFVMGSDLHRLRCSLHVHANDTARMIETNVDHLRIGTQPGNVIHNSRSASQCLSSNFRFIRVDRNWNVRDTGEAFDDRHHAAKFFVERNRFSAGTRGLTADIKNVRPFSNQPLRLIKGQIFDQVLAPIRETVGSHIDDPHDQRAFTRFVMKTGKCPDTATVVLQHDSLTFQQVFWPYTAVVESAIPLDGCGPGDYDSPQL